MAPVSAFAANAMRMRTPYRWRCDVCGRFIGFRAAHYEWTPFGGYLDTDPPDEERAHPGCFERYGKMPRQWIGPVFHESKVNSCEPVANDS